MLVLSRKVDQEIIIDENIRIRVLKGKGNTIRLGIDAPSHINIARGELKKKKDSRQSVAMPPLELQDANFTIVFDANSNAADPSNESKSRDAQTLLGLPVAGLKIAEEPKPCDIAAQNAESDEQSSIGFRGKLPTPFHRNRLQEIVNRMASSH